MALLDKPQLLMLAIVRRLRELRRLVRSGLTSLTGFAAFVPEEILTAPTDLRTTDPSRAEQFYIGRYLLAGVLVETGGGSPFKIENAEPKWKRSLHQFGWLRHLRARGDSLSASHAREIIQDWIENGEKPNRDIAWDYETASYRLIYFLSNSDLILNGASLEFYNLFSRSLGAHVRFLKRYAPAAPSGMPRLLAYIALSYASICHSKQLNQLKFARENLSKELDLQVFPDGAHVTRKPDAILSLLGLLLPYRQACVTLGVDPGSGVVSAIERMMLALRFFRLGDGNLARFNGTGVVETDLLSTLTRYDETRGRIPFTLSNSGFQRLENGSSLVLMDIGNAPSGETSSEAHAGCLSFEMSSARELLIVNCGATRSREGFQTAPWRSTAAHSVAVFEETSSFRFENTGKEQGILGGLVLNPNLQVEVARNDTDHGSVLTASHLGYARDFGVRYQRTLTLDEAGNRLRGAEWFSAPDKSDLSYSTKDRVHIHFHLHPLVRANVESSVDNSVVLTTYSGERWLFSCVEVKPQISESIFFAHAAGPQRTMQVVLAFEASQLAQANWTLRKL